MEWLVCAATRMELTAFWRAGESHALERPDFLAQDAEFGYAVTGVGIPFTFGRLLPLVQRLRPRRILNIGIAGAYPNSGLKIGDIVIGKVETYGDLGFELPDEPGFQSLIESAMGSQMDATGFGLLSAKEWVIEKERVIEKKWVEQEREIEPERVAEAEGYAVLNRAVGCTVNSCAGTEHTGLLRERLFSAKFETMEGAAVAHIGFLTNIRVCEVRAISNIAAHRDMRPENIQLALRNLNHYLQRCREKWDAGISAGKNIEGNREEEHLPPDACPPSSELP